MTQTLSPVTASKALSVKRDDLKQMVEDAAIRLSFGLSRPKAKTQPNQSVAEQVTFSDGATVTRERKTAFRQDAVFVCASDGTPPIVNGTWTSFTQRKEYLQLLRQITLHGQSPSLFLKSTNFRGQEDCYSCAFRLGEAEQYTVKCARGGVGKHIEFIRETEGHFFVAQLTSYQDVVRSIERANDRLAEQRIKLLRDEVCMQLRRADITVRTDITHRQLSTLPLLETSNGIYVPRRGDGIIRADTGCLAWLFLEYINQQPVSILARQAFLFKKGAVRYEVFPPYNTRRSGWPNPELAIR